MVGKVLNKSKCSALADVYNASLNLDMKMINKISIFKSPLSVQCAKIDLRV